MKCPHQFIKLSDVSKMPVVPTQDLTMHDVETKSGGMVRFSPPISSSSFIRGVLVICALCAERRRLWEDGTITQ